MKILIDDGWKYSYLLRILCYWQEFPRRQRLGWCTPHHQRRLRSWMVWSWCTWWLDPRSLLDSAPGHTSAPCHSICHWWLWWPLTHWRGSHTVHQQHRYSQTLGEILHMYVYLHLLNLPSSITTWRCTSTSYSTACIISKVRSCCIIETHLEGGAVVADCTVGSLWPDAHDLTRISDLWLSK